MTEATEALTPLISRLAVISQTKTELEAEEKQIKTTLREQLDVGTKVTINGNPVLAIQPYSRFDPALAVNVIPDELRALCTVETVDSKRAKELLPPALYRACCKNYEPRVVLL